MVKIEEVKHIGNMKLSNEKKAVKIHLFSPEKFLICPISQLENDKETKRIYMYQDGKPELVGELQAPKNKGESFWNLILYGNENEDSIIHIKNQYINLMKNYTNLTLGIYEE